MKTALLFLLLFSTPIIAQDFALVGADTACFGNAADVANLDCDYLIDDAGWSPAVAWCQEADHTRLVIISWKEAAVSSLDPLTQADDVLLGYLPESFIMGSAQAACDSAGIVYLTLVDGSLWRFDPDLCSLETGCSPTLVGDTGVNTTGGDFTIFPNGETFMVGDADDQGIASTLYHVDLDTALTVGLGPAGIPTQAWGLAGPVAFANDSHAYRLFGADLGRLGFDFAEFGDGAAAPDFDCTFAAHVDRNQNATIRVRHVRPEVDTTITAWVEQGRQRVTPILRQDLTLSYLEEFTWQGHLTLPPGSYRLVAEIERMGQGRIRRVDAFTVSQ